MLTTTRREIINDYDISQNRPLRNFAPDYNTPVQENREPDYSESSRVFDRRVESFENAEYFSRSSIAQKLYGQDYQEEYDNQQQVNENDYTNPDLMPSLQTMQITRRASYRQPAPSKYESEQTAKQKFTTRSKILIASYAAVLLALVMIITLTTVSIVSLFADVNKLETQLNGQIASIEVLDESIEQAGSPDVVIEKASQMGMKTATPDQTFAIPATKAAQSASANANWFDQLCDGVTNVFGG